MNVATIETGMDKAGMIVERTLRRKKKMVITTNRKAIPKVIHTS